ncbi:hypothetical protein L226DRAFT_210592 [Lentinus tigrinus ALCF2SS1-7]|uniref:uncharacterized protein n=1 Tax=Lentinus tigrinus ALCF2SS1-7 TaxID=1328758 RepID=UPI001165FB5B|nr:hypothetical protein L226DRAFT_210592 [Lentinus tigrinus ALCF2SS1-7]
METLVCLLTFVRRRRRDAPWSNLGSSLHCFPLTVAGTRERWMLDVRRLRCSVCAKTDRRGSAGSGKPFFGATSLPKRYPRPSPLGVSTSRLHPHTLSFNSSLSLSLRSGISHGLTKAPEGDYQAKKQHALTRRGHLGVTPSPIRSNHVVR